MTHTVSKNRVTFSQEDVEIFEVSTRKVVAVGVADNELRMYKFSHFRLYSSSKELQSHANEINKLWNEWFGHLNYRYLQSLSK